MRVTVKVAATTANLGPGYDALGLALSVGSEFTFEHAAAFSITGCPSAYASEDNLCWVAFKRVYALAGVKELPAVHIHIDSHVPVARGLGSSSTCVVAGVLAANAFLGQPYGEDELFQILNELEGHPDNAAAALYGGLTASFVHEGRAIAVRCPVASRWRFVAIIPNYEVSTHEARRLLKTEVPLKNAVFNLSHTVAVVKALELGDEALLGIACEDTLHQPLRKPLIPEYDDVQAIALSQGASAFMISGSGSTMLAVAGEEATAERIAAAISKAYPHFGTMVLEADSHGARVTID